MIFDIDYSLTAPVFNIQSYSIHDGPGIRTTVFLKGCPLRCFWCANPESNAAFPELMTYSSKCTGCGGCLSACPLGAISLRFYKSKFIAHTDRSLCTHCGKCVPACPSDAREIAGKEMTVGQVIDRVRADKLFLESSGGGMTISGGEALAHPHFSAHLLAAAHTEGIHTAVESCVYAPVDAIDLVFPHVDLALLDIKHMDTAAHKNFVGVPNEQILSNIRHICNELNIPTILRMPTIPGYNDNDENIRAVGEFAASLRQNVTIHLLPYHRLGDSKSESLGKPRFLGIEVPDSVRMESRKAILETYGIEVQIGG